MVNYFKKIKILIYNCRALDEVDRRQKRSFQKNSFMSSGIGELTEEDISDMSTSFGDQRVK